MPETQPTTPNPETPAPAQAPGSVITPAGAPRAEEHRTTVLETPLQPGAAPVQPAAHNALTPEPAVSPPIPAPAPARLPAPVPIPEQTAPAQEGSDLQEDGNGIISWTASEFIAHEKSSQWYLALIGVTALITVLVFLVTRDTVSSLIIIICAAFFGFYANRKPRQLQYQLSENGFSIGARHFSYDEFRSFSVMDDGAFSSIVFSPLKRFATLATIYFAPEDEDDIIAVLSDRLPYEEHTPDAVDRLMRKIRF